MLLRQHLFVINWHKIVSKCHMFWAHRNIGFFFSTFPSIIQRRSRVGFFVCKILQICFFLNFYFPCYWFNAAPHNRTFYWFFSIWILYIFLLTRTRLVNAYFQFALNTRTKKKNLNMQSFLCSFLCQKAAQKPKMQIQINFNCSAMQMLLCGQSAFFRVWLFLLLASVSSHRPNAVNNNGNNR